MSRRKVLGVDPLGWIKPTVQEIEKQSTKDKEEQDQNQTNKKVPKFRTYEVQLTLRLREDQLEFLSKLEREIMKKRSRANRKERITKNSIIRAIIDATRELKINTVEIGDEIELVRRFKLAFSLRCNNL
ncbi:MAG: hypothetical protein QXH91_09265 [Candidatus Bathyarchaeia archaeon]